MEYMSVSEAALMWGISRKRVQVLCAAGRIKGAQRVGKYWVIPADAVKPADGRRKCAAGETKPSAASARRSQAEV